MRHSITKTFPMLLAAPSSTKLGQTTREMISGSCSSHTGLVLCSPSLLVLIVGYCGKWLQLRVVDITVGKKSL